ncbi:MAG: hypothetical protein ABJA34_04040 [Pseudonocardiales bacterium]
MSPSPPLRHLLAARARLLLLVAAALAAGAAMTATAAATGHLPVQSVVRAVTSAAESPGPSEAPESPEASKAPAVTAAKRSPAPAPRCPADVRNHGAYISSVARDRSGTSAEHESRVSAAAHSDCGRPSHPAQPGERKHD